MAIKWNAYSALCSHGYSEHPIICANVEDCGYFENLAGTDQDLNHILATFDDADHEIVNFCNSRYITF